MGHLFVLGLATAALPVLVVLIVGEVLRGNAGGLLMLIPAVLVLGFGGLAAFMTGAIVGLVIGVVDAVVFTVSGQLVLSCQDGETAEGGDIALK